MAKANTSYYNLLDNLVDQVDPDASESLAALAPGVPKAIRTFLGRLSMLQEVPYHYLVPDARLVPVRMENGREIGALRFFWIDPLWVQSLLSGALSVGEDYNAVHLLKKAMTGDYIAEVFHDDGVKRLKDQLSGTYTPAALEQEILNRLNAGREEKYRAESLEKAPPATVSQANWRYTGFLLRSSLVASLKGLEVTAKGLDSYDDTNSPRKLSVLRLEYIASDTLFCLCEGIVTQVVITQPAENLHFGFSTENDTCYKMINENKKLVVKQRNNRRTLQFNGADGIIAGLGKATGTTVGSGDIAAHLMAQPIRHTVTIDWQEEKQ